MKCHLGKSRDKAHERDEHRELATKIVLIFIYEHDDLARRNMNYNYEDKDKGHEAKEKQFSIEVLETSADHNDNIMQKQHLCLSRRQ